MGIHKKIYDVMCGTATLEKDLSVGTGSNSYRAVGEKTVLNMLKPLFKEHKLIIYPKDGEMSESNTIWESEYKGNKTPKLRSVTQLKVKYVIVDIETDESIEIVGFGNGADPQDKGSGKAFTYAFKAALSKTFMMFSGEDTDNTHSDDIGGNKPTTTVKTVSEAQLKRLWAIGKSKGYTVKQITDSITKNYKKTPQELTRTEYDSVVSKLKAK